MDDLLELDLLELDEQILTFGGIPDEALERAANAEQAYTWASALTPGITARGHNKT